MESAGRAITRRLPEGLRQVAEAQDEDRARRQPWFLDPGQNDDFLFVQLQSTTHLWAGLAVDHARQAWPQRQQRSDYFAGMARIAYEAGNDERSDP